MKKLLIVLAVLMMTASGSLFASTFGDFLNGADRENCEGYFQGSTAYEIAKAEFVLKNKMTKQNMDAYGTVLNGTPVTPTEEK